AFESSRSQQTMAAGVILLLLALVIFLFDISKADRRIFRTTVVLVLLLGFSLNSYYKMSLKAGADWLDEFLDRAEADSRLITENADAMLYTVNDNDFYRIEEVGLDTTQNSSIQRGVYGTQFYHSMTNPYISEFIDYMYMNWPKDYDYEGVESRSILEALASVKYLFVGEGADQERPFNYSKLVVSGNSPLGQVAMYEADTALPLGYTYSEYLPFEKFEKMDPAERADAMLNAAVMEESSFAESSVSSDSADALESIESKGRIEISDNRFFVRGSGTVTLKLDALPESETYVVFDNLKYKGITERESYDDGEWANLTEYEKNLVYREDRNSKPNVSSSLMVNYKDLSKIVEVLSPGADFYCGRSNFLVNLGYNEEAPDEVTISFRNPGEYTFDSLKVISKPVENIAEGIEARAEDVMTDTVIGVNTVRGTISLDKDKILLMTVPYSTGWTVYVDGEKADLKRANIMYMAVELTAGDHEIELRYETPYLRIGAMMSLAGILMLAVLMIVRTIIKKKR
nr:YfhO family protein [Lachnospiraceae bacterium]